MYIMFSSVLKIFHHLIALCRISSVTFCEKRQLFKTYGSDQAVSALLLGIFIQSWCFHTNSCNFLLFTSLPRVLLSLQPYCMLSVVSVVFASKIYLTKRRVRIINKTWRLHRKLKCSGKSVTVLALVFIFFSVLYMCGILMVVHQSSMENRVYIKIIRSIYFIFVFSLPLYDSFSEIAILKSLQNTFFHVAQRFEVSSFNRSTVRYFFKSQKVVEKFFGTLACHRILLIFIAKSYMVLLVYVELYILPPVTDNRTMFTHTVYILSEVALFIVIIPSVTWGRTVNEVCDLLN